MGFSIGKDIADIFEKTTFGIAIQFMAIGDQTQPVPSSVHQFDFEIIPAIATHSYASSETDSCKTVTSNPNSSFPSSNKKRHFSSRKQRRVENSNLSGNPIVLQLLKERVKPDYNICSYKMYSPGPFTQSAEQAINYNDILEENQKTVCLDNAAQFQHQTAANNLTRNDRKLLKQYRLILDKQEVIKFEEILSKFARENIVGEDGYIFAIDGIRDDDEIDCISVDSEGWVELGIKAPTGSSIQLEIANSIKRLLVHTICRYVVIIFYIGVNKLIGLNNPRYYGLSSYSYDDEKTNARVTKISPLNSSKHSQYKLPSISFADYMYEKS